jgi:hypothetical protein
MIFEKLVNSISDFIGRLLDWIPGFNVDQTKNKQAWDFISFYINQAEIIFPVQDFFLIMGIVAMYVLAVIIFWSINFLAKKIPFIGG